MARDKKRNAVLGKLWVGLNSGLAVVLAFCLFGIVNYTSYRHHFRADISQSQFYTLSEKTGNLLASISNRVDVTVYARPGRPGYDDIVNLLEEYSSDQPLLKVTKIDPDRDIGAAEEVVKQYEIEESNVVVFDMGGKSRIVKESDIVDLDKSPLQEGRMPEKSAFRGEQVFTSALQSIASDERPVVYFLQGHGEGDPHSFDAKIGYSRCAEAMERDNIDVETLNLGESQGIPDDCAALVVAGPSQSFGDQEVSILNEYLEDDGSILLMLESMREVGLRDWLKEWNVKAGLNIVMDKSRTISGRELFVTEYNPHRITHKLEGASSIFYMPCSVEPIEDGTGTNDAPDRRRATLLATSSSNGWAETDWENAPMKYNPESERAGSIGVAVAVERGLPDDLNVQVNPTRMVVVGDSSFVSNGGLAGANIDFFLNSLDWLLEREELISIAPKRYGESRLLLTRTQIIWLGVILVFGLPLLVALSGCVVWLFRRH